MIWLNSPKMCGFLLCGLLAGCLGACAAPSNDAVNSAIGPPAFEPGVAQPCKQAELVQLWQHREADDSGDFAIGPGDVITVSVPEVEELQKQEVRVSSEGTIGLSLIGTIDVAGMDENDLRAAIARRLAKFMKYPRVELFVERYQTREVAVIGAVQKPGRYDLANMNQSIIDMIGRAGGMTADSAQKVIFVPPKLNGASGENFVPATPLRAASRPPLKGAAYRSAAFEDDVQHPVPETASEAESKGRSWIVIDLANPQAQACLDLPTRPGDVVIVPIAGQVMVQGWVKSPGAFKITPGMTVLGAVSAAGGAQFSTSAEILRTDSTGKHVAAQFDLTKLTNGEQADVPVQSGDVVVVESSAVGAIPFVLEQVLNRFGAGMYLPIP
ncbi:MAG: polysaccharide biosynthesis/export family protein [Candidatus Binataceae bacterium]